MLYRSLSARAKVTDAAKRAVQFTAATQGGVKTPWGREHLVMAGMRTERFSKNPILLDAHRRESSLDVIGQATSLPTIEGDQLVADVEFHDVTDLAKDVWKLVDKGFVRSMSIGYDFGPEDVVQVAEGATYRGQGIEVQGPAIVIEQWELLELSVLPLGADEDALRRDYYSGILGEKERPMKTRKKARAEEEEPEDEEEEDEEEREEDEGSERMEDDEEEREEDEEERKRALKLSSMSPVDLVSHRERVLAIAPSHLREYAEELLLEGRTFDDCRRALLARVKKRARPLKSPEPKSPRKRTERQRAAAEIESYEDDAFIRAFGG